MNYRVENKPAFAIVGKALRVPTKDDENLRLIPAFWQECSANGTVGKVASLGKSDGETGGAVLGVCTDFAENMESFTYVIAVEADVEAPDGMVKISVPALAWAAFEAVGAMPESIQGVWGYIMSEFFEAGEYSHGPGPDLEVYPEGNPMSTDYKFEVWVPVVRK